jgi:hypothetical protein
VIAAVIVVVAVVLAVAAVAVMVLATAGARSEPARWLPTQATGLLGRVARRILGLHVRRPSAHARDVPELRRPPSGAGEGR